MCPTYKPRRESLVQRTASTAVDQPAIVYRSDLRSIGSVAGLFDLRWGPTPTGRIPGSDPCARGAFQFLDSRLTTVIIYRDWSSAAPALLMRCGIRLLRGVNLATDTRADAHESRRHGRVPNEGSGLRGRALNASSSSSDAPSLQRQKASIEGCRPRSKTPS